MVAFARSPLPGARTLIALGSLMSVLVGVAGSEPLTSIPNPRHRDGTWVTDMPGILRAETIAQLNSTISDLERTTFRNSSQASSTRVCWLELLRSPEWSAMSLSSCHLREANRTKALGRAS